MCVLLHVKVPVCASGGSRDRSFVSVHTRMYSHARVRGSFTDANTSRTHTGIFACTRTQPRAHNHTHTTTHTHASLKARVCVLLKVSSKTYVCAPVRLFKGVCVCSC